MQSPGGTRPITVIAAAATPGQFDYVFKRLKNSVWETLPIKTTVNPDQSRWTGIEAKADKPTIYILGDSYVFGVGVNDEQTFAYHLQMARPDYNVKLFALGGYSLVHSYLRMAALKSSVTSRDIIILGYADFYDVRHVAAPSRLRDIDNWFRERGQKNDGSKIPVASIAGDKLSVNLVSQDCESREAYCKSADPTPAEMAAISSALVREIANVPAKTYLLYFKGGDDNPVLKAGGVEVISARPEDFGYFIRDDVEGFDSHPGPYWHYSIARKLISTLKTGSGR